MEKARPPAGAWDDSGHDILELLRARDHHYVTGFTLLPFKGFTSSHSLTLDLGGKGPGKYDIDAKVQNVPAGLNLEGVSPTRVSVELREAPPPPTPTPAPQAPPTGG